jgi:DNA-binding transcriptional LysR family regulator
MLFIVASSPTPRGARLGAVSVKEPPSRDTRQGDALAARRVLRDAGVARDAVAAVRCVVRGRLRIGMVQSLTLIDAAALFATFHRAHPDVALQHDRDTVGVLRRTLQARAVAAPAGQGRRRPV